MTATSADSPLAVAGAATAERRGRAFVHRLARGKGAIAGLVILVLMVGVAIFAPLIAPDDPIQINPQHGLYSPGFPYLFGTDQLGRDILSRVLFGARLSLVIGLISVGIASSVGILVGLIAGYYGGRVETVLMRIIDVMLAFPGILLALAIVSVLGPSLTNLMIAVGVAAIPTYARLTRGSVLTTKENLYIDAARVIGVPNHRIIARHIMPNVVAPLIVAATLGVGAAILSAAALSFLGLGSQPPTPEWGRMLSEGRQFLSSAWWISTFPGFAIMLTVLAINMIGDGLRDTLDPRLRQ
jgi:peptide/nickel transport system permease protein